MIKQILAATAMAVASYQPIYSHAQSTHDHGKMHMSENADMTDGEVKKVDAEAGKVTIKHGDIKHLDMPGMTMVFTARDKALLASIKPGDKVRFMVEIDGGKMILTDIQPTK